MHHLTDDQIQNFLQKSIKDSVQIAEHLDSCKLCKKQVEAYKQVFSSLEAEPDFSLPFNFADKVVSAVETNEDKTYKKWESFLLIFSIIQGIGLAIYFLDINKLFGSLSVESSNFFQTVLDRISKIGNGFLSILFFALIILTFYGFLDRIINQFKHQST